MKTTERYEKPIVGRISRRVFDRNLDIVNEAKFHNIVTYGATNLLAKAIAGDNTVKISHIRVGGVLTSYYAIADASNKSFAKQTPSREDLDMYYAGNPNPGNDLVIALPATFVRFEGEETVDLTPDQQTTNVVFYKATLDFNTGNGYTFDELGMFGNANTVLFSHAHVDPIGKTSAFQIEYEWSLIFR